MDSGKQNSGVPSGQIGFLDTVLRLLNLRSLNFLRRSATSYRTHTRPPSAGISASSVQRWSS